MSKQWGPWKIKKTHILYKDHWVQFESDDVIKPDNTPGKQTKVKIIPGVAVLAIDDHDFVYLNREFHYAVGINDLEVMCGGIEKKETPLHAAKRELKEELGITAMQWVFLGKVHPFTSTVNSPVYMYIAKNVQLTKQQLESTELIERVKVSFDEAFTMALKGDIVHAPSALLLLKAYFHLKKNVS